MNTVENYGVICSITWNSNKWQAEPTEEDFDSTQYKAVRENRRTQDCLNFAHEILPLEEGGVFKGYSSTFNKRRPSTKSAQNLKVLFFISTKYGSNAGRKIVGMYGFPYITSNHDRTPLHELYSKFKHVNLIAQKEDIVLLDNYLPLSDFVAWDRGVLPMEVQLSDQGFNYLNSDNVQNLLAYALAENPDNHSLKRLIQKLGLNITPSQANDELDEKTEKNADSLSGIAALEEEMQNQVPIKQQRTSSFIERGRIANKVKELTDYTCQVCQSLGIEQSKGFKKDKGGFYIEAHHVIPVARRERGTLSVTNIITVCATHHRQFHYGQVTELENTEDKFRFDFDGTEITIPKIKIPGRGQ